MPEFAVFDAPDVLPPALHHLTAVRTGNVLAAIGIRRGRGPSDSALLTVFSFSQTEYTASPDWPKEHAMLALLAGETGVKADRGVLVSHMGGVSSEQGTETSIVVDQYPVAARRLAVGEHGWIVWSVDPGYGVSVAGYDVDLPALRSVNLDDFAQSNLAEVGLA